MRGQVEGAKREGDSKQAGVPDPNTFRNSGDEGEEGEDHYAEFEQQRQMEILGEQDEALEGVFKTVGNLREQADAMGRELEEQGELLDSVDHLADRVGGKLQEGLKKIGWVIKNNEGMFWLVMNCFILAIGLTCCNRYLVELLYRCPHTRFDHSLDPRPHHLSVNIAVFNVLCRSCCYMVVTLGLIPRLAHAGISSVPCSMCSRQHSAKI